jgi:hypothetical protein
MENKQTAVKWLEEKLDIMLPLDFEWDKLEKIINQAKEMEKEENEYFFNCGRQYQLTGESTFTEVNNET